MSEPQVGHEAQHRPADRPTHALRRRSSCLENLVDWVALTLDLGEFDRFGRLNGEGFSALVAACDRLDALCRLVVWLVPLWQTLRLITL